LKDNKPASSYGYTQWSIKMNNKIVALVFGGLIAFFILGRLDVIGIYTVTTVNPRYYVKVNTLSGTGAVCYITTGTGSVSCKKDNDSGD